MDKFFKRQNGYVAFVLATALAISFVVNSIIFTWRAVPDANVSAPLTIEQSKQKAFDTCVNDDYNPKVEECGKLLK